MRRRRIGAVMADAIETSPQNVFCARCRTKLRARMDTDGDGGLIELVEPCPKCLPQSRRGRS